MRSDAMKGMSGIPRPAGRAAIGITLAVIAGLFVLPFVWMLATSLKTGDELYSLDFRLLPRKPQWSNYAAAWGFLPFGKYYVNSIVVGVASTALVVATSSLAAYAFARIPFSGRDKIFVVYLGTLMIPFQVTIVPLYILLNGMHWINSYAALIIPGAFTAFGTFMLRQFFMGIPMEYEEAAFLEGATRLRSWSTIIMPLAKPAIISLVVFTFIGNWNSFLYPMIVTDSDALKTLPLGLALFSGQHSIDWQNLMAASAFCILPPILVFAFFQRYFIQGITVSGMGGR
jgi:multiple sugar transport system permease protein